jgi:molecular chaperone GrpE
MILNKKQKKSNRIPVRFTDEEGEQVEQQGGGADNANDLDAVSSDEIGQEADDQGDVSFQPGAEATAGSNAGSAQHAPEGEASSAAVSPAVEPSEASAPDGAIPPGPMLAELIATRSELKRIETDRQDLIEKISRRQADFDNYRKRTERERGDTYQRMVGDVVGKLLPVMDNLRRALEAEALWEKSESKEFAHFLHGVQLIYKQLNDVLEDLGVQPVAAVGHPFDPHLHEAVATEPSGDVEPDTVTQELLRGYLLGGKLLRPAMVKVSTRE